MNKFDWRAKDRNTQVALFVVGMLDRLKEMGLVEGGMFQTTPEGMKIVEDMEAAANAGEWQAPTFDEIQEVLASLNSMVKVH